LLSEMKIPPKQNVICLPNGCTTLSSFLQPNIEIKGLTGKAESVKAESVAIRRLDDVLDEVIQDPSAARVFLKMDTEDMTSKSQEVVLNGSIKSPFFNQSSPSRQFTTRCHITGKPWSITKR
jgi:hypothetical protein